MNWITTLLGGLTALALSTSLAAASNDPARGGPRCGRPRSYAEQSRIDVHAHYLPDFYRTGLASAGITAVGGIPLFAVPTWSPDNAIAFMDAHGIAVQLLSISDPGVSFVAPQDQAPLARQLNDYVAGVIQAHPSRFGAFAVVPMQSSASGSFIDINAAVAEVGRALDTLGLDGVGLLTSYGGKYLGDPTFEPLLQELDRRGAWVFVHPQEVGSEDRPSYQIPTAIAEYPFDTTRTIISLIFNGAVARHPGIRWQFAHGGGTVAMHRRRLTGLAKAAQDGLGPILGLPPGSSVLTETSASEALAGFFYDTALIGDCPAVAAVNTMAGSGHMVFGSDWPFAFSLYGPSGDPQPALSEAFTRRARQAIDRLNLRTQFPRLQSTVPGR